MKKIKWNDNWTVKSGISDVFMSLWSDEKKTKITLPFDCEIFEERNEMCPSVTQSGYYPSKTYTFEKNFYVEGNPEFSTQIIELEGVMSVAQVYINDEYVCTNKFGYSGFFVDMTPFLKYGEENTIKVIAKNNENGSRWYSGGGIYRDVNLYLSGESRIVPDKYKLTTEYVEDSYAVISAEILLYSSSRTAARGSVFIELKDSNGITVAKNKNTIHIGGNFNETKAFIRFTVDNPILWSPDNPYLYSYRICLQTENGEKDEATGAFGIRTLLLDAKKGLRINGIETKLRGACVHHDNGIIGAVTLPDGELFKVQSLKKAGFNAIRSAHHPISKAMLDACDKTGVLVMDELFDMWSTPKNENDTAYDFADDYKEIVCRDIDKNYNHPSVIMYSIGNEIPDISTNYGGHITREIVFLIKSLDKSRYVTAGLNGYLAVGKSLRKIESEIADDMKSKNNSNVGGAAALNDFVGKQDEEKSARFALSNELIDSIDESACALDIAGYNYLTALHEQEHSLHPDRVVVGSETYAPQIPKLWKIVKSNHHVIGDFTWTGLDYLGEAGIGIHHYFDTNGKQGLFPDRISNCGDINLNYYRKPISYLREIAYGLRSDPFIGVEPPDKYGQKYDENNWKYFDCINSWTWNGFEDKPIKIRVMSNSERVELFLNDCSLGVKRVEDDLCAVFQTVYKPGILKAISYCGDEKTGEYEICTADEPVAFNVELSSDTIKADGEGAAFVIVDTVDKQGIQNTQKQKNINIAVNGVGVLEGFGNANPSSMDTYKTTVCETFNGRVMAVVRAGYEKGTIKVKLSADGLTPTEINIETI